MGSLMGTTAERYVRFRIRFHTQFGQSLLLSGDHPILGSGDPGKAIPLEYFNNDFWQATIQLPRQLSEPFEYWYLLRDIDGSIIEDWGADRALDPAAIGKGNLLVVDSWNTPGMYENAFYTEPFKEVLLASRHTDVEKVSQPNATHSFRVKTPMLRKGQTVCLLGSSGTLGNWNTAAPILLSRETGGDYYVAELNLSNEPFPLEYKYGVYDVNGRTFVRFEEGSNRRLDEAPQSGERTILNDGFLVVPLERWRGAGVAIPVFSLRSQKSFGAGEFSDLKLVVDWCRKTGLQLIQILPVNDTSATHTWVDSYPYAAVSAFALHPLYLNLSLVADEINKPRLAKLEPLRQQLNALEAVDYEAVMKAKMEFLRETFPLQREQTFASSGYRSFFEKNKHWLVPYAAFCYLRDKYATPNFTQWTAYSRYNPEDLPALEAEGAGEEMAFHYFIQFHLHVQLEEATEYAHANGVIIKGDIAIGVYRYGADVWQQPELFHLDMQAGAPPDAFAAAGQNWTFPTYNWERMREDGYAWWKRRFEQMSCYFDAFRIDHILGFFRIWSIPWPAVEGILGRFVPAIPVKPAEFFDRGIPFNVARYTHPYITDAVIAEVFGEDANYAKDHFLEFRDGELVLKPAFATQRQVEVYFAGLQRSQHNQKLKSNLFDLLSNVILLFDEHGQFHFRFGIEKTSSFRHLEPGIRAEVMNLYIDYFFRRQDPFWRNESMLKLPALKRVTNMLICGEDLGLVPDCVPEVMRTVGLLSLEIQRMPKSLHESFFRPSNAPYLSVVTPSTHDMSTIRGWWEEDMRVTQRFYNNELGQHGQAPIYCEPWINRAIVEQHLASPAMWSIFQLQDLLGMDANLRRTDPASERINIPAITGYYWRYRLHLTIEQLIDAHRFNGELLESVRRNGRMNHH